MIAVFFQHYPTRSRLLKKQLSHHFPPRALVHHHEPRGSPPKGSTPAASRVLGSSQTFQRQTQVRDAQQAGVEERAQAERPGFRAHGPGIHAGYRAPRLPAGEEKKPSTGGTRRSSAPREDAFQAGGDVRAKQASPAAIRRQGGQTEGRRSKCELFYVITRFFYLIPD